MIKYGSQSISEEDLAAVLDVLKSDFLTQGPAVPKFEAALNEACFSKHTTCCSSATAALHLSLLTLEVGVGDIVWTSPISFVASANAALYTGAKIDFVDINLNTFNICEIELEKRLKLAAKEGALPKVLIPVHMCGASPNMKAIKEICDEFSVKIVEDASHAIGASYLDVAVGSCSYSDITVFSFHPVKIITTGEGGAALTNCSVLDQKLKLLRSHGITRDNSLISSDIGGWYYEQHELGFNYRMTDIQAALGTSQLKKLDEFIVKRQSIADRYNITLKDSGLNLPIEPIGVESSWHLYVVRTNDKYKRRKLYDRLISAKIGANVHYIPIHLQPYYQKLGYKLGDFPNAELYYDTCLTIPIHPNLSEDDIGFICDVIVSD